MKSRSEEKLLRLLEEGTITRDQFHEMRENLPEPDADKEGGLGSVQSTGSTRERGKRSATSGWYFLYRGLFYFFTLSFILCAVQTVVPWSAWFFGDSANNRFSSGLLKMSGLSILFLFLNLMAVRFFGRAATACRGETEGEE
jgi:hypothetical protein